MERTDIGTMIGAVTAGISGIGEVSTAQEINDRYVEIMVASSAIVNGGEDEETASFITGQVLPRLDRICNSNLVRVAYDIWKGCTDRYDAMFRISMCRLSLKGDEDTHSEELYILDELINTLSHHGAKRNTDDRSGYNQEILLRS